MIVSISDGWFHACTMTIFNCMVGLGQSPGFPQLYSAITIINSMYFAQDTTSKVHTSDKLL